MADPGELDLRETAAGTQLRVRVVPRAGRTEIAGTRAGALLVRVAAAPVEGAANEVLVALLADRLDLPRRRIRLVAGAASRDKRVEIEGLSRADLLARLGRS